MVHLGDTDKDLEKVDVSIEGLKLDGLSGRVPGVPTDLMLRVLPSTFQWIILTEKAITNGKCVDRKTATSGWRTHDR